MKPDIDQSVAFLQRFAPEGPWALTAINKDRSSKNSTRGKTFWPDTVDEMRKWLYGHSKEETWNIYFHVNSVGQNKIGHKADKSQIEKAGWLYVDVDPEDGYDLEQERARILEKLTTKLPKGIPEPTVITFSGGGYQAFWKLKNPEPIDGTETKWLEYERYNKRLEQVFQADNCHNVERIMRLPGTVNNPDPKKVAKGRSQELAKLLQFNDNEYDLDLKFQKATQTQTSGGTVRDARVRGDAAIDMTGSDRTIMDLSELDEWDVPTRVKVIISQGKDPEKPKEGDNSRSAWVFDAVCNLLRLGVPEGIIYSLLTDKEWRISESVLEQKDPHRYAIKQIISGKEFTEDPHLHEMNERHAVIGNMGGKCVVIEEVMDEVMNRSRITFSSFADIGHRYNNRRVAVGQDKDGKPVVQPLGKYWINHPMRAQYDFIKFAPDGAPANVFNMWRGFAVQPSPGDCSMYLEHIRENICGGNEEYSDYVLGWMARAIQYPQAQGEVAIVLRGGKGTGKSVFASEFGKIFGRHFLHVSNPAHLVGNFNAHLKDTILLFADEAFYANDRKHESVLKMLITESTIPIEAKHVDVEPSPNYIHLIMASNDPHVVRATGDERRYLVLDVLPKRQRDDEYFGKMIEQLENGGREALLFYLQNYDLSEFNVRKVPDTEALQEQKLLSMDVDEEWWFRKLESGRLLENHSDWVGYATSDEIETDYTRYTQRWNIQRRGNASKLGKFLARVAPHLQHTQRTIYEDVPGENGFPDRVRRRKYCYDFGSLEICRQSWEKIHGNVKWPDITETQNETIDAF